MVYGSIPWQSQWYRQGKLQYTTHATNPILFINFSTMFKWYHAILMEVVKQYLMSSCHVPIIGTHFHDKIIFSHLKNVKCHSVTWPYTMTTPYWTDFVPNSTFYRILSGFHRTFATDVACRQGTLTPPDTWSRPFGTCICSTCWGQSFSELVVILPDYALRISLGTFSILLCNFFVALFVLSLARLTFLLV